MKIFIILALVAFAAADWKPISRQELKQIRLNCMKDLNMPQDLKDKANRLEYPDNELMKQFVLCGARGSLLWDDSKGWLADRVLLMLQGDSNISKEEMLASINECNDNNSQGGSLQEWAYRGHLCMLGKSKLRESFMKMMKKLE